MKAKRYRLMILMSIFIFSRLCAAGASDPAESWGSMNISQIDEAFDLLDVGSFEFGEAEKYFDSIIQGCPGSDECASAYYGKGRVLNDDKEEYKKVVWYFDKALELDPSCCQCLDQKSWSLFSLEDYDGAMQAVNDALEMCPTNAHAWNNKGIYYYLHYEDYKRALECFNTAIKLKPDFGDAWWDKYKAHLMLGQKDEADAALATAMEYGISEQGTGQEE